MQRKWYTMTCTGNFRNFGPDIAEIFGQCALKQEYVSCTLMLITSPNLVKCQIHIDKHWLFSFSSHSIILAEIEMLIFWTGQGWAWKSSVDKINLFCTKFEWFVRWLVKRQGQILYGKVYALSPSQSIIESICSEDSYKTFTIYKYGFLFKYRYYFLKI